MFFVVSKIAVWLIYPLSLAVLLLMAAYAAHLWRKRALFHTSFLLALLILYLCSIQPVSELLLKPLERKHVSLGPEKLRADAIVVLSGDVRGKIPPASDIEVDGNRVIKAVRLFKRGAAPVIIMTGGSGSLFEQSVKEAVVMKELAVELGVPANKIIIETESRNTRENILYTKPILDKIKAKKIILVTAAFHMARSYALAEKIGIDALPAASDFYVTDRAYNVFSFVPSVGSLHHSSLAIKEYVGIFLYWVQGWV